MAHFSNICNHFKKEIFTPTGIHVKNQGTPWGHAIYHDVKIYDSGKELVKMDKKFSDDRFQA